MFEIFDGHVSGLDGLLELLLIETVQVLLVLRLVLTFLFEDLCVRPLRRFLAWRSLSLIEEWLLGGVGLIGLGLISLLSLLLCRRLIIWRLIAILHLDTAQIPLLNFCLYLLSLLVLSYDHTLRLLLNISRNWYTSWIRHYHYHLSVRCLFQIYWLSLKRLGYLCQLRDWLRLIWTKILDKVRKLLLLLVRNLCRYGFIWILLALFNLTVACLWLVVLTWLLRYTVT